MRCMPEVLPGSLSGSPILLCQKLSSLGIESSWTCQPYVKCLGRDNDRLAIQRRSNRSVSAEKECSQTLRLRRYEMEEFFALITLCCVIVVLFRWGSGER